MRDVRQILAGHAKTIRKVVVPGSDDYFFGGKLRGDSLLVARMHAEIARRRLRPARRDDPSAGPAHSAPRICGNT